MNNQFLSLQEAYKLLSQGKKIRKPSWLVWEYVHIVDDCLKDNFERVFETPIQSGAWVEYKEKKLEFDDLLEGNTIVACMDTYKHINISPIKYKLVYTTNDYIVLETEYKYALVLFRREFEELNHNELFVIEQHPL